MNKYAHTSRITLSIRYNRVADTSLWMLNMEYQLTLNWPDFLERHWQKRPVVFKTRL
ncbi:cupin superfamily protein family [Escherichia coli]|uniref:Cupin superfamily protein family n=1 Tax=Escherichia coli TaxID=562 RepID=A0A377F679_ECOLX|nr:cupin superfamily protein family [Escherichia coli]